MGLLDHEKFNNGLVSDGDDIVSHFDLLQQDIDLLVSSSDDIAKDPTQSLQESGDHVAPSLSQQITFTKPGTDQLVPGSDRHLIISGPINRNVINNQISGVATDHCILKQENLSDGDLDDDSTTYTDSDSDGEDAVDSQFYFVAPKRCRFVSYNFESSAKLPSFAAAFASALESRKNVEPKENVDVNCYLNEMEPLSSSQKVKSEVDIIVKSENEKSESCAAGTPCDTNRSCQGQTTSSESLRRLPVTTTRCMIDSIYSPSTETGSFMSFDDFSIFDLKPTCNSTLTSPLSISPSAMYEPRHFNSGDHSVEMTCVSKVEVTGGKRTRKRTSQCESINTVTAATNCIASSPELLTHQSKGVSQAMVTSPTVDNANLNQLFDCQLNDGNEFFSL